MTFSCDHSATGCVPCLTEDYDSTSLALETACAEIEALKAEKEEWKAMARKLAKALDRYVEYQLDRGHDELEEYQALRDKQGIDSEPKS